MENTTGNSVKAEGRKEKLPKKKKKLIIWLVIIIAILSAVGVVAYKNIGNIKALKAATTMTREEIEAETEKNDKASKEILSSLTDRPMHNLSDEEKEMLKSGELTEDDAVNIILGVGNPVSESKEIVKDAKKKAEVKKQAEEEKKAEKVSHKDEIIARLYYLKSEYLGKIEGLIAMGKSEAASIKGANRNLDSKFAFIDKYMGLASGLESGCDAKVNSLLSQLEKELKENGEDTSVIGEIRSYYQKEKQLKKAEIYNRYVSK